MTRSIALLLALGCSPAAQACSTSSSNHIKSDISRPIQPPASG